MAEMKTVKEVCRLTGLTRKLLHDYDRQGIVKPSGYANMGTENSDGYKLYDNAAVIKLYQAAIFRRLHLERSDIKKRLTNPNYDANETLDELVVMLEKEKNELDNLITVAKQLKLIGINKGSLLSYYARMDYGSFAENQEKFLNSAFYKELAQRYENPPEKYQQTCDEIFESFELKTDDDIESEETEALVRKLIDVNIQHYGMGGVIFVFSLAIGMQGGGEFAKDMSEDEDNQEWNRLGEAIMKYFKKDLDVLMSDFVEIIVKHHSAIGMEYSEPEIGEMVNELKGMLKRHFGISSQEDYDFLLDFFPIEPCKKDDYIGYALNAIKYYCV